MHDASILIQLAAALLGAKIVAEMFERWFKQPAVLGELLLGVLIGGSVLRVVDGSSEVIKALAELGAILLLFEVGLESDIRDLFRVGGQALFVAVLGVVTPMALGYLTCSLMGMNSLEAVFVGAALTATSVGITARVFSDLKALSSNESHIVLGAAVIDDVLGLMVLAAVTGAASSSSFQPGPIALQAAGSVLFLVGSILLGIWGSKHVLNLVQKMNTRAALSIFALGFCFVMAFLAKVFQLAPIVGAFAAGLVLNQAESKVHFEEKIKSTADMFIPMFFVLMGANIDLSTLNPFTPAGQATHILGLTLTAVAVVGKVAAGLLLPTKTLNRWIVGIGMIPRGEVGLIFASIGLSSKIIPPSVYSAIVFLVIITTFVTPPLLKIFIKQRMDAESLPDAALAPEPAA